jgi:hypothetical protein
MSENCRACAHSKDWNVVLSAISTHVASRSPIYSLMLPSVLASFKAKKSAEQHIEDAGITPYTMDANLQVPGFLRSEPEDFKGMSSMDRPAG